MGKQAFKVGPKHRKPRPGHRGRFALGECGLCAAQARCGAEITQHHLVPKETWGRGLTPEEENETVCLCLKCHWMLHQIHGNEYLAAHCRTLEAIRTDPLVRAWAEFRATLRDQEAREAEWQATRVTAGRPA